MGSETVRERTLTNTKWPHGGLLGVDLVNVGNSPGEMIDSHVISVLVLELGGLLSRPGDLGVGISLKTEREKKRVRRLKSATNVGDIRLTNHAGHDTANVRGDLEEMGHGGGIQQLVL